MVILVLLLFRVLDKWMLQCFKKLIKIKALKLNKYSAQLITYQYKKEGRRKEYHLSQRSKFKRVKPKNLALIKLLKNQIMKKKQEYYKC